MGSRLALVLVLFVSATGWAQIVVIKSAGERIEPVGLVPVERRDAVRQLTSLGAVAVGFVYEFAAVYTIDFWRTNGRFCLYMDDKYWVVSADQAATLLGVPAVSVPWSYWLPPGLIALLVAAVLFWLNHRLAHRGAR